MPILRSVDSFLQGGLVSREIYCSNFEISNITFLFRFILGVHCFLLCFWKLINLILTLILVFFIFYSITDALGGGGGGDVAVYLLGTTCNNESMVSLVLKQYMRGENGTVLVCFFCLFG